MTKHKRGTDPRRALSVPSGITRDTSNTPFSNNRQDERSKQDGGPIIKGGHLARVFVETLKEYGKSVAVASGAITIGTLAFFLTPLKDNLAHLIWQENAEVLITVSSERIREGNPLNVTLVLSPKSSIDVSEGILTVYYSENSLALISGEKTLSTPRIKSPILLPENSRISFIGTRPGSAEISIELRTKYGVYQARKEIEVEASTITGRPSKTNLSGEWNINMDHDAGKMELLDKGGRISGTYYLETGQSGVIGGIRDGTTFVATFFRGSSPTKWSIQANYKSNDEFLEITGHADLYKAHETEWKKIGDSSEFYATAHLYIEADNATKRTK